MGEEIGALQAVPGQGPCLLQPRWDICLGFTSLPQPPPHGEKHELGNTWEGGENTGSRAPSLTCIPGPGPTVSMETRAMTTTCSTPPPPFPTTGPSCPSP